MAFKVNIFVWICTVFLCHAMADPELQGKVLYRTKHKVVGIDALGGTAEHQDEGRVVLSFRDGCADLWRTRDLYEQKHPVRITLTPANQEFKRKRSDRTSSVSLSTHQEENSHEDNVIGFEYMRISECHGPRNRADRYFFEYRMEEGATPKVSYAPRLNGHAQCQVYPQNMPSDDTRRVSAESHNGKVIWMIDSDYDLLAHYGTDKEDCCNRPLVHRLHDKIVSLAACCNGDWVFVGLESGDIVVFSIAMDIDMRPKISRVCTLPPSCGCNCQVPIPVQLQVCCSCDTREYKLVALFKKCDGQTFLYYWTLKEGDGMLGSMGTHVKPGVVALSEIIDFKICCCLELLYAYLIVKSEDGSLSLVLYSLTDALNMDMIPIATFIAKAKLPCDAKIEAWTLVGYPGSSSQCSCSTAGLLAADNHGCCALIAFHVPRPCTTCTPCPPRHIISSYCLRNFQTAEFN